MDPNDPRWKGKGIAQPSSPSVKRYRPLLPGQPGIAIDVLRQRAAGMGDMSIPTQKAIQQALHGLPSDELSTNYGWKTAVQEGYLNMEGYTTLDNVKKLRTVLRFELLVVLVSKVTPNPLGDLILTLKDPTAEVEASLHHKVRDAEQFAGKIKEGACLILQKITVFRPYRNTVILNITLKNVQRVIEDVPGLDDIVL